MRVKHCQFPYSRPSGAVGYISSRDSGCGTGRKLPGTRVHRLTNNRPCPRYMEVIKYCNGTVIGDPCHIIRSRNVYNEFLAVVGQRELRQFFEWLPFEFHGITGQIYHTDREGFFFGVPVDSGMVINVSEEDLPTLLKFGCVDLRGHVSYEPEESNGENSEYR